MKNKKVQDMTAEEFLRRIVENQKDEIEDLKIKITELEVVSKLDRKEVERIAEKTLRMYEFGLDNIDSLYMGGVIKGGKEMVEESRKNMKNCKEYFADQICQLAIPKEKEIVLAKGKVLKEVTYFIGEKTLDSIVEKILELGGKKITLRAVIEDE